MYINRFMKHGCKCTWVDLSNMDVKYPWVDLQLITCLAYIISAHWE